MRVEELSLSPSSSHISFVAINNRWLATARCLRRTALTAVGALQLANRCYISSSSGGGGGGGENTQSVPPTDMPMWRWLFPVVLPAFSRVIVVVAHCQQTAQQRR